VNATVENQFVGDDMEGSLGVKLKITITGEFRDAPADGSYLVGIFARTSGNIRKLGITDDSKVGLRQMKNGNNQFLEYLWVGDVRLRPLRQIARLLEMQFSWRQMFFIIIEKLNECL